MVCSFWLLQHRPDRGWLSERSQIASASVLYVAFCVAVVSLFGRVASEECILSDGACSIGRCKFGKLIHIFDRFVIHSEEHSEGSLLKRDRPLKTYVLSGASLVSSLCSRRNLTSEISRQPALLNSISLSGLIKILPSILTSSQFQSCSILFFYLSTSMQTSGRHSKR